VLPLVDMSAAGDNEYFSDGLTEELLNVLAKIRELRVAGRTSSFAFKGQNQDLREIAQKLSVNNILEGSVRKDDTRNRVRITLQLINAEDGYHLWSETYDRDLEDIFAIQEDVAREVAAALRVTLLGEDEQRLESMASTDISAYDLYLHATQNVRQGGYTDLEEAVNQLQQVLTMDPAYLPARLTLVKAWGKMALTGAITFDEARDRGLPVLESVLAQHPRNAEAHAYKALLLVDLNQVLESDRAFQRSLELDPRNAVHLGWYGRFLFENGEIERGIELAEQAVEFDPYSVEALWQLCRMKAVLQEVEDAIAACERVGEVEPDSVVRDYGIALAHLFSGDIARGALGYVKALEHDPRDYEMLAAMTLFWTILGDSDQAQLWLQRAEALGAGQPVPISARITLYQFEERHDLARELVKAALDREMEDRHGTNFFFRQINAYESLATETYDEALAPYRKLLPWAFAPELSAPPNFLEHLDDLIYAADLLKRAEPLSQRPEQLLALVEPLISDRTGGAFAWLEDFRAAKLATLKGDEERAIRLLNDTFDQGRIMYWRQFTLYDPVISRLRGTPGFDELIARYEAEMDRQRELAYELLGVGP
jgi:TolB-like protein/Flp pilus assembly protein TadD